MNDGQATAALVGIEGAMRAGPSVLAVVYVGGEFRVSYGPRSATDESLQGALVKIANALAVHV